MPDPTGHPCYPRLNLAALAHALGANACRFDADLLAECASTNALLLSRAEAGAPGGTVVIAECQTAGHGRRGRPWHAAAGDSLTFSLLWRFAPGTLMSGLSLAIGLAVARAIEKVGAGGTASAAEISPTVMLKWPNDLLRGTGKLGGILVELVPGAPHCAVIGIGINLRLPATLPAEVRQTAAALADGPRNTIDPNTLLANILGELLVSFDAFAAGGFAVLRDAWQARHAHQNAAARLLSDFAPARSGICRGVDVDGALLFEADGRIERVLSGEISLRTA